MRYLVDVIDMAEGVIDELVEPFSGVRYGHWFAVIHFFNECLLEDVKLIAEHSYGECPILANTLVSIKILVPVVL